ncbi:MAG: GNAT family N-acetyltransferase [Ornithinibacter sp.]
MPQDITVTHEETRHRWEVFVGDDVAGFTTYRRSGGVVDLTHTEVDSAFEGLGVGSTLVRAALDEIAAAGESVVATCPFVAAWLERHPDYQHLLAPGQD